MKEKERKMEMSAFNCETFFTESLYYLLLILSHILLRGSEQAAVWCFTVYQG